MSEPPRTDDVRGAAEETTGSPLTGTEVTASQRPASQPADDAAGDRRVADAAESLGAGSASDEVVVEPLEERPEVAAAVEDDTTAPGLDADAS